MYPNPTSARKTPNGWLITKPNSSFPTVEESVDEQEICDEYEVREEFHLNEEQERQLLLYEEALREMLEEEEATAEKEMGERIRKEEAEYELFRSEFYGEMSDSDPGTD
ncbi:hypothetical protein Tco_0280388 [Tanacetum coccineum]